MITKPEEKPRFPPFTLFTARPLTGHIHQDGLHYYQFADNKAPDGYFYVHDGLYRYYLNKVDAAQDSAMPKVGKPMHMGGTQMDCYELDNASYVITHKEGQMRFLGTTTFYNTLKAYEWNPKLPSTQSLF